jgi:hypothetical protein
MKEGEIHVTLTWLECLIAGFVGVIRRVTSLKTGMKDKAGRTNDWASDVEGCAGEIACAKALGIYWEPSNRTFSKPDVGGFEVKLSTKDGDLGVETNTPDNAIIILVIGKIPDFTVVGWITGKEAKLFPPYTKLYRPTHWVPKSKLNSIKTLDITR